MTDNAPGWQADPTGRHDHRYWDGSQWTDNISDAGIASTDAYAAADAADAVADIGAGAPADDAAPQDAGWADPTTTMPAAGLGSDPTAAWPATPAPPAPPSYAPPPPSGGPIEPPGSGGSKRGLLVGGAILAAVAVAVAAFLLLGGGDDEGDNVRTQLATQLRTNNELSDSQADCVADAIVDEMGDDAFKDVDFTADQPPAEIADELIAAAMSSLEGCDIDPAEFEDSSPTTDDDKGGSDGGEGTYGSDPDLDDLYDSCEAGDYQACDDLYNESPSGSEYEEFGDTCGGRNEPGAFCVDTYGDGGDDGDDGGSLGTGSDLPADFEQQLAEIYETNLGLPADKAECLADKIAEAVSSGDLSEEQAMSDMFGYFSDCDIDMSEITAN